MTSLPLNLVKAYPKPQLYTLDPLEGLQSQTGQSLQKPLLCMWGGHFLTPTVPPKFDPQFPSLFSMVVQFQEHIIWVLERRLIQELEVVRGERWGSQVSCLLRAWTKGGRSYEMGVYPLATYIRTIFKYSFQVPSLRSLYFLLQAHTLFCLLSGAHVCVCVCARAHAPVPYMSPHTGICSHVCTRQGCPSPTKSHRHTLSHLTIPPRMWSHRQDTHTQSERENIQYSIVHFSFPFTKSNGESRQLEKRNGGKPSCMFPIYPHPCGPPIPPPGKGTPITITERIGTPGNPSLSATLACLSRTTPQPGSLMPRVPSPLPLGQGLPSSGAVLG